MSTPTQESPSSAAPHPQRGGRITNAEARLYGHDPDDGVGGTGAFFLLLDEPEVYGLPPDPVVPTRYLPQMFNRATAAAAALLAGATLSFLGRRR